MSAGRALITGGRGQLGRALAHLLPNATALGRTELLVQDGEAVRRAIVEHQAEIVYNCAAYNAVDAAELDPRPAFEVNAEGALQVAVACRREGARMVHFSTNYVFAGDSDRPYTEAEQARPATVYGRSKLEGEWRVLDQLPSALVIRSAGIFGSGGSMVKGGSLPERLLAKARAGDRLAVVEDQRLNPTYAGHLATATIAATAARSEGVIHLVAEGCCSYHEFATELVRLAGIHVEVLPIATSEGSAARPRNGCLASLRHEPLPSWRAGLAAYLAEGA